MKDASRGVDACRRAGAARGAAAADLDRGDHGLDSHVDVALFALASGAGSLINVLQALLPPKRARGTGGSLTVAPSATAAPCPKILFYAARK